MPALPAYIVEPIWDQFVALLPAAVPRADHPLGCHRSRIPDRTVFEKLVQVLVFGCAYERIADETCSATTLRRRRDERIAHGVMNDLRGMALEAYDKFIGLRLADVAIDSCITKAPCGGEKAGSSPVIGANGASSAPQPSMRKAYHSGPSRPQLTATTRRCWARP